MKAILVIDVDDCVNVEACNSTVYVEFPFMANGWVRKYSNVSIKPMPEKNTWDITKNGHVTEYAEGYNACLDEILGETE